MGPSAHGPQIERHVGCLTAVWLFPKIEASAFTTIQITLEWRRRIRGPCPIPWCSLRQRCEVLFSRSAIRAIPIVRNVLKGSPWWDARIGVSQLRIINKVADTAVPFLKFTSHGVQFQRAATIPARTARVSPQRVNIPKRNAPETPPPKSAVTMSTNSMIAFALAT